MSTIEEQGLFVDIGNGTLWAGDIIGVVDITDELRADGRWKFVPSERCVIRTTDGSVGSVLDRATVVERWKAALFATQLLSTEAP